MDFPTIGLYLLGCGRLLGNLSGLPSDYRHGVCGHFVINSARSGKNNGCPHAIISCQCPLFFPACPKYKSFCIDHAVY